MNLVFQIAHWAAFIYYVYLFGYASLFKVFQKRSMMEGMSQLGFNQTWTLFIGYAELLGVLGLIVGLWHHQVKNLAVIWLFVFAVAALSAHFAHQDYIYFYDALFGCIAAVILLATNKHFHITL